MNRTVGVSPKVPVQAFVTIATFLLAYFGIELSPEVAGAVAALVGIVGGYVAPPGEVTPDLVPVGDEEV